MSLLTTPSASTGASTVSRVSTCSLEINKNLQSKHAIAVIDVLRQGGFQAYLVGGCVRDNLLGFEPKDFDIATNATPPQICSLFKKNARMIGRRFRIVHVRQGGDIIEVTTFRGNVSHQQLKKNEYGLITKDNRYGSIEEDARRRDFSVNALYYDTQSKKVLDFCDGLKDIENKRIRTLVPEAQSFQEDPVRMLRAIRFASKLDFVMGKEITQQIQQSAELFYQVSPARLFDEMLKLLKYGYAEVNFRVLHQYGIIGVLLGKVTEVINASSLQNSFVRQGLKNTDARISHGKKVSVAYIFSFLLWPHYQSELSKHRLAAKTPYLPVSTLESVLKHTVESARQTISIPNFIVNSIREIWFLQERLKTSKPKSIRSVFQHRRFRAAYDFLLLRQQAGEPLKELCQWWTNLQQVSEKEREKLIKHSSTYEKK